MVYLQRNYSLEEANRLAGEYKVWYWSIRWFRPGEETEYRVTVDTATATVLGFARTLPEAAPGGRLLQEEALRLADGLLAENGYDRAEWQLVGARSKEQPARTDHHFEWQSNVTVGAAAFVRSLPRDAAGARVTPASARLKAEQFLLDQGIDVADMRLALSSATSREQRQDHQFVWESIDPRLPESRIRRDVTVQGDGVGAYHSAYIHVPDAYLRQQAARSGWMTLGVALAALGGLTGLVLAVLYLVRRQLAWRPAVLVGLLVSLLALPPVLARWSATLMTYDTGMVWPAFLASQATAFLYIPLAAGAGVAAAYIVGTVVAQRSRPASPPPGQTALAGLATAGLAAGAICLIQWVGAEFVPPEPAAADITGGYWLMAGLLLTPVIAMATEFTLRLWLQSLLSRWLKSRLLGLLAQAVAIGCIAAIGSEPANLFRSIGGLLGLGLIYGVAYLAGGLPVVICAEVIQALFSQGLQLYGAGTLPAAVTGWVALALALLGPAAVWLAAWLSETRDRSKANRPRPAA